MYVFMLCHRYKKTRLERQHAALNEHNSTLSKEQRKYCAWIVKKFFSASAFTGITDVDADSEGLYCLNSCYMSILKILCSTKCSCLSKYTGVVTCTALAHCCFTS